MENGKKDRRRRRESKVVRESEKDEMKAGKIEVYIENLKKR